MPRPAFPLLALALLAAAPAAAQEVGGLRPGAAPAYGLGAPAPAYGLGAPARPGLGCQLSQTTVAIGVNRAFGAGSLAGQRVGTVSPAQPGCRPLVSTEIVAGVNLGLGAGSTASQTVAASAPRGSLATVTYARGVNLAAGPASAAHQQILGQIFP
jgi:hypothetical protein